MSMESFVEELFDTLNAEADTAAVEALADIGESFAAAVVAEAAAIAEEDGRDKVTAADIRAAAHH